MVCEMGGNRPHSYGLWGFASETYSKKNVTFLYSSQHAFFLPNLLTATIQLLDQSVVTVEYRNCISEEG